MTFLKKQFCNSAQLFAYQCFAFMALIAFVILPTVAKAQSEPELINRFKENISHHIQGMEYDNFELIGENGFKLNGVTFNISQNERFNAAPTTNPAKVEVHAKTLTVLNIDDTQQLYIAGSYRFEDVLVKTKQIEITLEEFGGSNAPFVTLTQENIDKILALDNESYASQIRFLFKGQLFAESMGLKITNKANVETNSQTSIVRANDITIHTDNFIKNPTQLQTLNDLGFSKIRGSLDIKTYWDYEKGLINIEKMALNIDAAGSLEFQIALNNYTKAYVINNMELAKKMNQDPQNAALVKQYAKNIQSLELLRFGIKYKDQRLTNHLLDYFGKRTRKTRQETINNTSAFLTLFLLPALQLGELGNDISTGFTAFLQDPKQLEIKTNLKQPIPLGDFLLIDGQGQEKTKKILEMLNLSFKNGE